MVPLQCLYQTYLLRLISFSSRKHMMALVQLAAVIISVVSGLVAEVLVLLYNE